MKNENQPEIPTLEDKPIRMFINSGVVTYHYKGNVETMAEQHVQGFVGLEPDVKRNIRFIGAIKESIAAQFLQMLGSQAENIVVVDVVVTSINDLGVMTTGEFYDNQSEPTE